MNNVVFKCTANGFIYTYACILFQIIFPFRLSQNIERFSQRLTPPQLTISGQELLLVDGGGYMQKQHSQL